VVYFKNGEQELTLKETGDTFIGIVTFYRVPPEKLEKVEVPPIFLVREDSKVMRDIIYKRGLWGAPEDYPDSVKEKEIEWVIEYNEYFKKEAKKYHMPIFVIRENKDYFNKIKGLLKL
jgi:hypothetical protein